MRNITKAAIIAFGVTGALAVPASAQSYDDGYYGPQDNQQQYGQQQYGPDPYDRATAGNDSTCDPYYGCPDDYDDQPVYDGSIYWDGGMYNGPFFYRDYGGNRQFWVHGGWHYGQSRGGHFGPAPGRGYFRDHGFAGHTGGFVNRGGYDHGNFAQGNIQAARQGFANRGYGGGNGGGWRGGDHFRQQAAQPQANSGGHNWSGGGHGGGHHGR